MACNLVRKFEDSSCTLPSDALRELEELQGKAVLHQCTQGAGQWKDPSGPNTSTAFVSTRSKLHQSSKSCAMSVRFLIHVYTAADVAYVVCIDV